jgi:Transglycosylase SLT domain
VALLMRAGNACDADSYRRLLLELTLDRRDLGLETDFGAGSGNTPTLRALATLAYDCRRSDMFQTELMDRRSRRRNLVPPLHHCDDDAHALALRALGMGCVKLDFGRGARAIAGRIIRQNSYNSPKFSSGSIMKRAGAAVSLKRTPNFGPDPSSRVSLCLPAVSISIDPV